MIDTKGREEERTGEGGGEGRKEEGREKEERGKGREEQIGR